MADPIKLKQDAITALDQYKKTMQDARKKSMEDEMTALANLRASKQESIVHHYKEKATQEWRKVDEIAEREVAGYDQPNAVLMALISLMLHLAYALNAELTKLGMDPTHLAVKYFFTPLMDWLTKPSVNFNETDIIKIDKPLDQLVTCENGELNFSQIELSTILSPAEKALVTLMVKRELVNEGFATQNEDFTAFKSTSGANISSQQLQNVLNGPSFLEAFKGRNIEFQDNPAPSLSPSP